MTLVSQATPASSRSTVLTGRRSIDLDPKSFCPHRDAPIERRYDIPNKVIGAGGFGTIFLAKDRNREGRTVAIKKVKVTEQMQKSQFSNEIRIMQELDHPNICKLLESYEQGRHMYFVMEYCEGGEVFERIAEEGRLAEDQTADIIRQCSRAVNYAHTKGFAHRDLKPENLCYIEKDLAKNDIKVIDWGLGRYFGQARMKSAVGSPEYAAPEVMGSTSQGQRGWFSRKDSGYTSACDVWSIGVLTYVMLSGKPPFWGNPQDQLTKMKDEDYPMDDNTWRATSHHAKDFIQKLLKFIPNQRPGIGLVLRHPWLEMAKSQMDPNIYAEVLLNMRQFSNNTHFFTLCVASVARQLDHKSLCNVHKVFCELDQNGDGVLDLKEIRSAFLSVFGPDSEECQEVDKIFRTIDLDGSGKIDYTEFCAAGIGERVSTQEEFLWAAFKTFDMKNDDDKITKDDVKQVLQNTDIRKAWSKEFCAQVASEVMDQFDNDGDGFMTFDEWVQMMQSCVNQKALEQVDGVKTEHCCSVDVGAANANLPTNRKVESGYSELVQLGPRFRLSNIFSGPWCPGRRRTASSTIPAR